MCFGANVFTPCSVFNAVRRKEVLGLYFSHTLKRQARPMEEPLAILRSPLPGGPAIKPYPPAEKGDRAGEKSPPNALPGIKAASYVNSLHTLRS